MRDYLVMASVLDCFLDAFHRPVGDIIDPAAFNAPDVIMVIGKTIEPVASRAMLQPHDKTGIRQYLEITVYRAEAYTRYLLPYYLVYFIGRGM